MNSLQSVWEGDECNRFKGTDSTVFPPFLKPEEGLWAFTPDICMSWKAVYVRKHSYAGFPTSVYTIDFGDMKVGRRFAKESLKISWRFITGRSREALLLPWSPRRLPTTRDHRLNALRWNSGLRLVMFSQAQCEFNNDISGSKPHFLDADPQLLQSVEGLHPNRSAHDVFVNFEAASNRSTEE